MESHFTPRSFRSRTLCNEPSQTSPVTSLAVDGRGRGIVRGPLLGRVGGLGFKFAFIEDDGKVGTNDSSV